MNSTSPELSGTMIQPGMGADVAVGLVNPKFDYNVAAVLRSASCYGVPQVWYSGNRLAYTGGSRKPRLPREERMRGYQEVELFNGDYFLDAFGPGVVPVAVEVRPGSELLTTFVHPDRAVYVFGPEDGSIDSGYLPRCHRFVRIPTRHCLNLATAVSTVLYDRHVKRVALGLEDPYDVADERGYEEPDHTTAERVAVR